MISTACCLTLGVMFAVHGARLDKDWSNDPEYRRTVGALCRMLYSALSIAAFYFALSRLGVGA